MFEIVPSTVIVFYKSAFSLVLIFNLRLLRILCANHKSNLKTAT